MDINGVIDCKGNCKINAQAINVPGTLHCYDDTRINAMAMNVTGKLITDEQWNISAFSSNIKEGSFQHAQPGKIETFARGKNEDTSSNYAVSNTVSE